MSGRDEASPRSRLARRDASVHLHSDGHRETRRDLLACALAGAGTLLASAGAIAQSWPSQPIRLIVPYPPAGATDVVGRLFASKVTDATGWSFVVDNRPGAGGNIGLEQLARSRPDGYTLAVGQTSNLAINPALMAKMSYDALRDFAAIAPLAEQPLVLVVRAESPTRTLAELVAAGRARPGALTMASAGTGTVGHLAGELFAQRAGFTLTHVPYKGAAPALSDLMGGQTDFMLPTPQAAIPLLRAGRLRALAVTARRRLPVLGDVPTVAESGYAGFEAVDWKVLVGPAGLPEPIVRRLNEESARALGRADTMATLMSEGSAPMQATPQQLAGFLAQEHARWRKVVKSAGITAQ